MSIFHAIDGKLVEMIPTTFATLGLKERADIQQFLKQQISVIAPDTLVIDEEFCNWEDSRRRIDLLGIDKDANLVVIELKRTEDGGHMELQALRYAAMVATLTFDAAVDTYARYLASTRQELDARTAILEFLEWDDPESHEFGEDVRIVLAAAELSKEITTTVLWLNDQDLDIRCVRLRPYSDNGRLLIDVQQVIPLPEAQDYQIKLRAKKVAERVARKQNRDTTRFNVTVGQETYSDLPKRRAIYHVIPSLIAAGVDPEAIRATIDWKATMLIPVVGTLDSTAYETALAAHLIENGRKPQVHRFFTADDELIHANGKTYAATKMWGERTTLAMDQLLKAFPNHGIAYREAE